jgi:hypothetical protein
MKYERHDDLKLIDELLCDLKMATGVRTWAEVEGYTSVTRQAMTRLRAAWRDREMASITLGLSNYFKGTEK